MSINDQFAGWEAYRGFAMREDTIDPKSQQGRCLQTKFQIMAQIFLLSSREPEEEQLMTTLRQIELRCPVCDNEFKSQSVVSTNAFGGKRTDFHERAAGTQPLAYLIHMRSECGYSW